MKTKNIIAILAALPIMAGVTACKSDEELGAKPAKEILRVEGGGVELRSNDKTVDVHVYADCAWQVLDTDGGDFGDKLSVLPKAGNGNGTLVITVDENTGTTERKDTIILKSAGGLMQKIPIRQVSGDPAMTISTESFTFAADDTEMKPFTITSNENWTLTVPPTAWFRVTDAAGTNVTSGQRGATTVFISADPAQTDADRTSAFTISYSGRSVQVEVNQTGMTEIFLQVQGDAREISADGGERMVIVESNAAWNAYVPASDAEWVTIEPAHGTGSGDLRIFCKPNNTTRERTTALVVIAGSRNPQRQVVLVEQQANGSAQPLQTAVNLYSLSVLRQSASFLFTIVSEEVVGNYGLVYSADTSYPSLSNGEVLTLGSGGTSQGVNAELNRLSENTTYYVRAYVEKPSTGEVIYSDVVTITTLSSMASVGDLTSLYVSNTSASFRFNFVADEDVIDYGLVYSSTIDTPTRDDSEILTVGTGGTSRNVLAELVGLQETTTYYVRAFVRSSSLGTVYGDNVVTITTSSSIREPGESDNPDPQLSPKR